MKRTPSPSAKRSAELKRNKNLQRKLNCKGTKMGGPLGDKDPKSNCKEVSRTKTQLKFAVELKL